MGGSAELRGERLGDGALGPKRVGRRAAMDHDDSSPLFRRISRRARSSPKIAIEAQNPSSTRLAQLVWDQQRNKNRQQRLHRSDWCRGAGRGIGRLDQSQIGIGAD